ncbi:Sugar transporter ERD6-like 5 [Citrus sinensis]|uniref:Sugar transporter ERD6-like 5 n=1 Tax=Citrus sinensis TaxID=2711 RepID=A0ACB8KKE5_CITSI|nr:Sugar transporter ERD6-like 5 [Citrus sinensis]
MKEFEASLQSLRGLNVDISQEAAEIKDYTNFLQQISGDAIMNLFQRKYIHSLIVGVGLIVFQRFGGVYVFLFYAGTIFESAGFSSRIGSITAAIVQIITTTLGAVLVDVSGRRLMLLISTVGACLGCIITALAFVFEVYLGFLQLGVGGIPWIIMSEEHSSCMVPFVVLEFYSFGSWYQRLRVEHSEEIQASMMNGRRY